MVKSPLLKRIFPKTEDDLPNMKDNSNNGNVKDGLYYLSLTISLILCLCSILVNFWSIQDIYSRQGYSDIYIFLEPKKAVYYSIFWVIIFTTLLLLICYNVYKGKRKIAITLCLLFLLSMFISSFVYKIMIDFRVS